MERWRLDPSLEDRQQEAPALRRPSRLKVAFWTFFGTLVLVTSTILLGFLTSIIGWLPPRGYFFDRIARFWSRLWLMTSNVDITASFAHTLDPKAGYVFMANHQSWYDIPALLATLPGPARFMAKKGLFQIPILGWALYAGAFIPVDRRDRSTARETFALASRQLNLGASVLLFPEETRSPDGKLLPFKKGGFLLALRCGFPIVPIGIRGTHEVRPKGSALIQPGPIQVHYGNPIDVTAYSLRDRAALMDKVRVEIATLCAQDRA